MASKSSVVRTAATNFVNATLNAYKAEVDAVYAKKAGLLSRAQADLLYMPISYASAAPVVTVPGNANDNWLSVNPDGTYDIDITRNITNAVYALAWVGAPYNTTPVEILPDENSDFRFQFNGVIQQGVADTKFDVHVTLFSPDGLITHYKFESGNVNATDYAPKIPAGQDVSIPISISYTSANGTSHFDSLRAVFTTPSISAVTNATTVSYLVEAVDVYGNKVQSNNIVALPTSDIEAVLDTSSVQAFQRRVTFSVRVKATYSNFFGSVSVENSVPTSNAYTEIAQTAALLFTSANLGVSYTTTAVTGTVNGDLLQATVPMYLPVTDTTLTLTQSGTTAIVASGARELYTGVEYTCLIPLSYDWNLGVSQAGITGSMGANTPDNLYRSFKFTASGMGVYTLHPTPVSGTGTSTVTPLRIPVCTRPKYNLQAVTSGTIYFKKDQTTSVSSAVSSTSITSTADSYIVKLRPSIASIDLTPIKNSTASVTGIITLVNDKGVQSVIDQSALSMSSITVPDLVQTTSSMTLLSGYVDMSVQSNFVRITATTLTATDAYGNGLNSTNAVESDTTTNPGTRIWFAPQFNAFEDWEISFVGTYGGFHAGVSDLSLAEVNAIGNVHSAATYFAFKAWGSAIYPFYKYGATSANGTTASAPNKYSFRLKHTASTRTVQWYKDGAGTYPATTQIYTHTYPAGSLNGKTFRFGLTPPLSSPTSNGILNGLISRLSITPTPTVTTAPAPAPVVNGQFAFGTSTAGVDSITLTGLQYSGGDSYVYVQPTTPTKLTYAQARTNAVQISGNQYTIAGLASGVQYDVYGLSSGSGGGTTACITTTVTTVSPTVSFDQVDVAFDYYGATGTGAYTNKPTATVKFSTVPTTSPVPYVYMTVKAVPSTTTYTDLASTTPVIGGTSVSYSFPNLEYGTTYTVYACAKRVDSSTTNGADTSVISKQFTTPTSEVQLPGVLQVDPTQQSGKRMHLLLAASDVPQRLKVVVDSTIRGYASNYSYRTENLIYETGAGSRLIKCGLIIGTSNVWYYNGNEAYPYGYSSYPSEEVIRTLTGRHTLVSYYDFVAKTYELKIFDTANTMIYQQKRAITGQPQPGSFPMVFSTLFGDEKTFLANILLHSIKAYKVSGP